jgi:hypothetical protein
VSKKRAKPARRAPPPSPPKWRSGRPPLFLVIGVLAVAVLGWWLLVARRTPGTRATPPLQDPQATLEKAIALIKQGRYAEGIPIIEGVVKVYPFTASGHHDYATALLNAVHQGRVHLGKQEFAVRSSVERVALVRTALFELLEAERNAREPADLAWALRTRAQAFGAWGFPWEALVGYRNAAQADTTWGEMTARAEKVLDEMQHPERLRP